jgi:hypothetical protein
MVFIDYLSTFRNRQYKGTGVMFTHATAIKSPVAIESMVADVYSIRQNSPSGNMVGRDTILFR